MLESRSRTPSGRRGQMGQPPRRSTWTILLRMEVPGWKPELVRRWIAQLRWQGRKQAPRVVPRRGTGHRAQEILEVEWLLMQVAILHEKQADADPRQVAILVGEAEAMVMMRNVAMITEVRWWCLTR